jgi:hypothetical protein
MAKQSVSFLTEIAAESQVTATDTSYFNDPLCGEYWITDLARLELSDMERRIKIAHVLATRNTRGR